MKGFGQQKKHSRLSRLPSPFICERTPHCHMSQDVQAQEMPAEVPEVGKAISDEVPEEVPTQQDAEREMDPQYYGRRRRYYRRRYGYRRYGGYGGYTAAYY